MSGAATSSAAGLEKRIHELAASVRDEVVETRRVLHRRPELAHAEHETASVVADRCEQLGYRVRRDVAGTGVLAELESRNDGPTLMIRADMDALALHEVAGRAYGSEHPGIMHACGHDGHMAVALGVAKILAALYPAWPGRVRFCFQPAEETSTGAERMIAAGALDGVDRVLGLHLWTPMPTGTVGIRRGAIFVSSSDFEAHVTGRATHAGMPHTGADAIVAACTMITSLQHIVSRNAPPTVPTVLTVGELAGGTSHNIIAGDVTFRGTVRCAEHGQRKRVGERIREVVDGTARLHGCTADVEFGMVTPAVVNDATMAELVFSSAVSVLGEDAVRTIDTVTVSDDVGRFLERVPGCYFLVGAGGDDAVLHHHPEFDIDERALDAAVVTLAAAAVDALAADALEIEREVT